MNVSKSTVLAVVLTAMVTQRAAAQGTANSPSTTHAWDDVNGIFWVGGPNDTVNGPLPIPIDLDANGGPWQKEFFSNATSGFGGGGAFRETILNAGTEPWTDWHETNLNIGSHGAAWGSNSVTDVRINGVSIGYSASVTGSTLNIDHFSLPVFPGQVLEIDKQFAVTTVNFVGPNTLIYTLAEFPTTIPEPASLALLGLGGLALFALRRRVEAPAYRTYRRML